MADQSHTHHPSNEAPSGLLAGRALTALSLAGTAAGLGVMLAPHLLPALDIGVTEVTEETLSMLHGGEPIGIAGNLNKGVAAIPLLGKKLAEGGLFNAAVTGVVGVGGVILGNMIEHKQDGKPGIRWGKVIRTAALITSALVALPTVLTAIGQGIIYLSALSGDRDMVKSIIGIVENTIGSLGPSESKLIGLSGLSATLPHFITCGVGVLSSAVSFKLWKDAKKQEAAESFVERLDKESHSHEWTQPYSDGSIHAAVEINAPLKEGEPATGTVRLSHAGNGQPITMQELAVVHTEKAHLFLVDRSMKDYHHIHPQPTGVPGEFQFHFTPNTSNNYQVWTEITPENSGVTHRLQNTVPGVADRPPLPALIRNEHAKLGDLEFHWKADAPLRKGKSAMVEVHVTDKKGHAIRDLEPVMGASAHLVGFSADGQSFVHTHPVNEGSGPSLTFHVEPHHEGPTQFFLQLKRHGQDMYVPFGQQILPPERGQGFSR